MFPVERVFLSLYHLLHEYLYFCCLYLTFPFSQKNSQLSSDDLQRDQAEEQRDHSNKDRKGKKNKKKRDRGSKGKGKGKRKGKGKKGSRKKKQEEESLHEESFLSVSTAAPEYLPQGLFQATEMADVKKTLETTIPYEDYDQTHMEMPTLKPDSATEAPTVVPYPLPETEVSEEVVYLYRPQPIPAIYSSNQSLPFTPPNHRHHLSSITTTTNQHHFHFLYPHENLELFFIITVLLDWLCFM